jgi:hypothetical protein
MPFHGIIHGKFWHSADNPQKVKLRARISPRICQKLLNYILTFIRGLLGIDSWKNETKKSHATVALTSFRKIFTINGKVGAFEVTVVSVSENLTLQSYELFVCLFLRIIFCASFGGSLRIDVNGLIYYKNCRLIVC